MTEEQRKACLEAAWEIEALALLLPEVKLSEEPLAALQLRGLAARMVQLSGVVMAGLQSEAAGPGDAVTAPP